MSCAGVIGFVAALQGGTPTAIDAIMIFKKGVWLLAIALAEVEHVENVASLSGSLFLRFMMSYGGQLQQQQQGVRMPAGSLRALAKHFLQGSTRVGGPSKRDWRAFPGRCRSGAELPWTSDPRVSGPAEV